MIKKSHCINNQDLNQVPKKLEMVPGYYYSDSSLFLIINHSINRSLTMHA